MERLNAAGHNVRALFLLPNQSNTISSKCIYISDIKRMAAEYFLPHFWVGLILELHQIADGAP